MKTREELARSISTRAEVRSYDLVPPRYGPGLPGNSYTLRVVLSFNCRRLRVEIYLGEDYVNSVAAEEVRALALAIARRCLFIGLRDDPNVYGPRTPLR